MDTLSLSIQAAAKEKWLVKFCVAFLPAFIGTGVLLGTLYVLVLRAIHVDRKDVEAWFEMQRVRLQSGPVPIIERAQPLMLGALYAIYGRSVPRRLATSFAIGLFFTSITFGIVYSRYKHVPRLTEQEKIQLEQAVDPILYRYFSDPTLRPEYNKSREQYEVGIGETVMLEYTYKGGIYDELRERQARFLPRLATSIVRSPTRVELTLLLLLQGTYLNPGFNWSDFTFLFLFNVFCDFVSVTIAITCLQRLALTPAIGASLILFVYSVSGTLFCGLVAFISYRLFFRGDTGFFLQAFIVFPLSVAATLGAAALLIHALVDAEDRFSKLLFGGMVLFLGFSGFEYLWSFRHAFSLQLDSWRDALSFPYVLAFTTLVPAIVSMVVFGLVLVAKLSAEPARVLPESYMTFVKEEVGGRQAAGIILLFSVIVGVIVSLIWPVS